MVAGKCLQTYATDGGVLVIRLMSAGVVSTETRGKQAEINKRILGALGIIIKKPWRSRSCDPHINILCPPAAYSIDVVHEPVMV